MSKRYDKVEYFPDDERPETSSFIRRRVQSREKAEYVAGESTNVRKMIASGLREEAECVEVEGQEKFQNKESMRNSEATSLFPLLSTNQQSWFLLLTFTDESEEVCAKFIRNGGLVHFMSCYDENPFDEDLLSLMLATLSNVSEHVRLRPFIMDDLIVAMFFCFLHAEFSISEGAASILCNLVKDGPEVWTVESPSWASVLAEIEVVIDGWNPDIRSQFRYNSLKPLLSLAQVQGAPACQKYALWILDNLMRDGTSGKQYQNMLKIEDGESVLNSIVENPIYPTGSKARAKDLLQQII